MADKKTAVDPAKTDAAKKAQEALAAKRAATKQLFAEIEAAAKAGTLTSQLINQPITDGKEILASLRSSLVTVQELVGKLEAVSVGRLETLATRIRSVAFSLPTKAAELDDMKKIRKLLAKVKKLANDLATAITSIESAFTGNGGVMKQVQIAAKQYESLMKDAAAEPEERAG